MVVTETSFHATCIHFIICFTLEAKTSYGTFVLELGKNVVQRECAIEMDHTLNLQIED